MAKDRHRIFEIYESRDEATSELMPKSIKADNDDLKSETSSFSQLVVSQRSGVMHVGYKEPVVLDQKVVLQVRDEFAQLAAKLDGDSRVLIDFTGVQMFGPAAINVLIVFNKKLQHRGSRMVLCCLDTNVRASIFAAH